MKVILDAEVYYQLRGAAAGARGVLSAMRELHPATAPNAAPPSGAGEAEMNTKYTPGPWAAKTFAGTVNVWSSKRKPDGSAVCYDCKEADARLIAAAPDLLEALQEAFRAFAFDDEGPVWADSTIAKARAAIAKATGSAA